MGKFKPLGKVTGKVHKISPARPINAALLNSLGCEKGVDAVRMAFSPAISLAELPPIRLPEEYLARVACRSRGNRLNYKGKAVPAAGIEARPPRSQAELKRVYRLAHRSYLRSWGPKVAGFYLSAVKEFEKKYLPRARSLIMSRKGKPAAFYCLLKVPRPGGAVDLVAWHNPIVPLSAAERRSAWHQAASWMNTVSKRRLVVGLDSFDKDSIRAFAALGFRVDRVRALRA